MARCQSVGTTAVVRELANSLDKGSAKKISKPGKWRLFLADLESNPDPVRKLRTIKSLFGTIFPTMFTEPRLHKDRTFTNKKKPTHL